MLIFVFALLKNLIDDYSTIWSYIGVLLAAGVAYGAWLRYRRPAASSRSPAAPSEPAAPPPPPPSTPPADDEAPERANPAGPSST